MRGLGELLPRRWREKIPLPAVLVLAAGCLLLLLPAGGTAAEEEEEPLTGAEAFDLAAFERRLEDTLSRVAGAGETRVVLSVMEGSRQVLAQDREQDGSGASATTVTVGGSARQQVVPIQTLAPCFRGALVVCPGAADPAVRLALTQAVSVLTGLGSDRICVTAGGG